MRRSFQFPLRVTDGTVTSLTRQTVSLVQHTHICTHASTHTLTSTQGGTNIETRVTNINTS